MGADSFGKQYQEPTKAGISLRWFVYKNILNFLSKRIDFSNKSLLELGPGRGVWVDQLKKLRVNYHAIEGSQCYSQILNQRMGGDRVIHGMCPPISFPDNHFDLVMLFHFLEHMADVKDAVLLIQEIKRVLKPEAMVVIGAPDILYWRHYFFDADYTHNFATSQRRIRGLLIDNNFSVILCKKYNVFLNCFDYIIHYLSYYFPASLFPASLRERLYNLKYTFLFNSIVIAKKKP